MNTAALRRQHQDWLGLLDRFGPFLTVPVCSQVWPAGLDPVPGHDLDRFRPLFAEWREDPASHHRAWIGAVLIVVLGWGDRLLQGPDVPSGIEINVPEHGENIRADFAFRGDDGQLQLLGIVLPPGTPPAARLRSSPWTATPADRLALLLRQQQIPIGLATDGRWWSLVWAPLGGVTSITSWDAVLWLEEKETLRAFRCLLERRRFLGVPSDETLPKLLQRSLDQQEELTESLGRQVRQAVEMLVEAIGRASRRGGKTAAILRDIEPHEIYAAAVTVMMRLVFLLFAEERLLLPADDELYLRYYSATSLVDELRQKANESGEEALEHRTAAWQRLLSLFRGVHGGIAHDRLRLPAYGGGVFDPERYPWLEGSSDDEEGGPLLIDDRTVLHALEALQFVKIRGERRRITFGTLDVEQIGYVYEGLLGYDAWNASDVVVGLAGKEGEEPEVKLAELEAHATDAVWLEERTGLSQRTLEKLRAQPGVDLRENERWLRAACGGDESLVERLVPFAGLLRPDLRGLPVVILAGGLYVTTSPRRRLSGTHYTPRHLAETVVEGALEPLVYSPGPLDSSDRAVWKLRPSSELLGLRIADIAMGSGAFLVAACRYLTARVIESWAIEGDPAAVEHLATNAAPTAMDAEVDAVVIEGRRRVIEHCLYGGDINEMAVEMAKLSLWLVSLGRERPFSFLDDRLVVGDSLLGLTSLSQLRKLHVDPKSIPASYGERGLDLWDVVGPRLEEVERLRKELVDHELREVRDAQYKARLLDRSRDATWPLQVIADAIVGAAFSSAAKRIDPGPAMGEVAADAVRALRQPDPTRRRDLLDQMAAQAAYRLDTDKPSGAFDRRPTQWPLVFPEVFDKGGFDAVVGNPPFLGGKRISGAFGDGYREFLVRHVAHRVRGNADLIAFFVLVAHSILNREGQTGLIGTNTLAQGDTREVGLDMLVSDGVTIRRAVKSAKWPTRSVNLEYAVIWTSKGRLQPAGQVLLEGREVNQISPSLDRAGRVSGNPARLAANQGRAFIGSFILGIGFTVSPAEARRLVDNDPRNKDVLFPFLNGEDLNQTPDASPRRWVINFGDWPLEQAEGYPECLEIVRHVVKPERDRLLGGGASAEGYARRWWQYGRRALALYPSIAGMARVISIACTSKAVMPLFVPADWVYSHAVAVFAYDDSAHLALLSSSFHYWWAITHASTMRTDLRYTPSDVFETFPQPQMTQHVDIAGQDLESVRRPVMLERQIGLTALYNLVHDAKIRDRDVQRIRDIHVEIDEAVSAGYGWTDVAHDHGFHATRQGVRFTIAEAARTEIIDRLLELNHQRYADEVDRGLHHKGGRKVKQMQMIAEGKEVIE